MRQGSFCSFMAEWLMDCLWSAAVILAVVLLLLWAYGCATVEPTHAAHYHLTHVNGQRLPVRGVLGSQYVGGSVELFSDGAFVDVLTLQAPNGIAVVDSMRGTYRVQDSVRFAPDGYVPYAAKLDGGWLFVAWAEGIFTYKRD